MDQKRLKIAFLNIYQGRVGRGAETFIEELSVRLSQKYDVEVIAGGKSAFARWPILWRFFLDPTGLAIFLFTLRQIPIIWRKKYDILIPLNGGWQSVIVRLITWVYGGKVIISGQSGIGWDDRFNILTFPNVFVGISSKASAWARKVNPLVKSMYIPNGVDLKKFNPQCTAHSLSLPKPIVLCVSALTKSKNIDLVIKAVKEMENASLLVIGDGYLREEINFLGRSLLKDRFDLKTFPHEQMPGVYGCADVFVLTSDESEAFGIVYAEAMASGLPVVARDDEQRREIVGDAGVLTKNPENSQELAEALKKALSIKWAEKPRRQAEKFDWEKIARQYEELFRNLML